MWRKLTRPDSLFIMAVAQALSPYAMWAGGYQIAKYPHYLTYIPILIWSVGLVCFLLGTNVGSRTSLPMPKYPTYLLSPNRQRLIVLSGFLIAAIVVQLALIYQLYGTFPMLSFLRNDRSLDVNVSTAMQTGSGVGQIALLYLSVFVGSGLILLQAILNLENRGRRITFTLHVTLVCIALAGLYNGKRQGILQAFLYLTICMAVYSNHPLAAVRSLLPILRRKVTQFVFLVVALIGLIQFFGVMVVIRNQNRLETSGFDEVVMYYEFPVLNLENQCASVGLGPYKFSLLYPVRHLLPYKFVETMNWIDDPPRTERSAPAGLYEDIQWAWGLPGVAIFSFLIGWLSMFVYRRTLRDPKYLLIYGQIAFSLFFAHSFNFFLILVYVVAPTVVFLLIGLLLTRHSLKPVIGLQPVRLTR